MKVGKRKNPETQTTGNQVRDWQSFHVNDDKYTGTPSEVEAWMDFLGSDSALNLAFIT